jgi:biopolymer transport protein ExbB
MEFIMSFTHAKRPLFAAALFLLAVALPLALFAPDVLAQARQVEELENPYGLEALWKAGDFVSKGTLAILVVMSMGSWYIIVTKLVAQQKLLRQASELNKAFWGAGSLKAGAQALKAGTAYRFIADSGLEAADEHRTGPHEQVDFNTWVAMGVQRADDQVQARLQGGLAFLGTVGSTAPFVGLFGTVWGIYHALTAIGISGQASIDKVAGPVGEALIMTAIGLAVAVPAVLGYNWLIRRNKTIVEQVRSFGDDLHSVLMGGRPKRAAAAAAFIKGAPAASGTAATSLRGGVAGVQAG